MEFIKYLAKKVVKDFPNLTVIVVLFILVSSIVAVLYLNFFLLDWVAQYIDIVVYDSTVVMLTFLEALIVIIAIYIRNSFKQFKTEKMHRQMFNAFMSGKKGNKND